MYSPARLLPTKLMALIEGSSMMKSTVLAPPCMTLSTPGGIPAFSASSARIIAAPGSRSDGFRIRQLPVTVAIGIDHSGIIAGKSIHNIRSCSILMLISMLTERTYGCHHTQGFSDFLGLHVLGNLQNLSCQLLRST